MNRVMGLLCLLVCGAAPAVASTVNITDGNFSNWTLTTYGTGGGSATDTLLSSGGDPGAQLEITTTSTGGGYGAALSVDDDAFAATSLSGNYTLVLSVLEGPGDYLSGEGIRLLVEQNGAIYAHTLGVTGVRSTWTNLTFTGTFLPSSFTLVQGSGPTTPDFSGATTTYFGFGAYDSGSSTLSQYYDNFSLTYSDPSATPEPGSAALLGTGLAAVAAVARRRVTLGP